MATLFQKTDRKVYFILFDAAGGEITGIIPAGVKLELVKQDEVTLTEKALTTSNFTEIGLGLYAVDLTEADTDILGTLFAIFTPRAASPIFDQRNLEFEVAVKPLTVTASPSTCLVFGNVKDLSGLPSEDVKEVVAQIVALPNITDGTHLTVDPIKVFTDVDGFFKMNLVRGALVRIEIADAGVRRQFTVPDQDTVDLADLP